MINNENNIIALGRTNFRGSSRVFGIKADDRRRHVYIIGKTGMGKTELLVNMIAQDIKHGHGLAFVDPHGENADRLLDFIPKERIKDVIYFNPADTHYPIAFNVMEKVAPEFRHLVASGMMQVFKKLWPDVWSPRMEYILNNSILALLEVPDSTLIGINRMFSDAVFRKSVVDQVKDPVVKAFWVNEFARYADRFATEATAAIQNKVGQFISNPLIRNIIGQVKSAIDMRKIMDEGKIIIFNLSKGKIGEDNSRLLGALAITKLQLAAMSRVDTLEHERRDFFLYVDEFQNFATESFASILSEARKYHLDLVLAHQYIAQMEEVVRDAAFGNVGTIISFRIGAEDAAFLEKEFAPEITAQDLVNLGKWNIYIKLLIDGIAPQPFSAVTLPPPPMPQENFRNEITEYSRKVYGTPQEDVEKYIQEWSGFEENGNAPLQPFRSQGKRQGNGQKDFNNNGNNQKIKLFELLRQQDASNSASQSLVNETTVQKVSPVQIQEKKSEPVKVIVKEEVLEKKETIPQKSFQTVSKPAENNERKKPNLGELRDALSKALAGVHHEAKETTPFVKQETQNFISLDDLKEKNEEKKEANTKGILKPGDRVKFD